MRQGVPPGPRAPAHISNVKPQLGRKRKGAELPHGGHARKRQRAPPPPPSLGSLAGGQPTRQWVPRQPVQSRPKVRTLPGRPLGRPLGRQMPGRPIRPPAAPPNAPVGSARGGRPPGRTITPEEVDYSKIPIGGSALPRAHAPPPPRQVPPVRSVPPPLGYRVPALRRQGSASTMPNSTPNTSPAVTPRYINRQPALSRPPSLNRQPSLGRVPSIGAHAPPPAPRGPPPGPGGVKPAWQGKPIPAAQLHRGPPRTGMAPVQPRPNKRRLKQQGGAAKRPKPAPRSAVLPTTLRRGIQPTGLKRGIRSPETDSIDLTNKSGSDTGYGRKPLTKLQLTHQRLRARLNPVGQGEVKRRTIEQRTNMEDWQRRSICAYRQSYKKIIERRKNREHIKHQNLKLLRDFGRCVQQIVDTQSRARIQEKLLLAWVENAGGLRDLLFSRVVDALRAPQRFPDFLHTELFSALKALAQACGRFPRLHGHPTLQALFHAAICRQERPLQDTRWRQKVDFAPFKRRAEEEPAPNSIEPERKKRPAAPLPYGWFPLDKGAKKEVDAGARAQKSRRERLRKRKAKCPKPDTGQRWKPRADCEFPLVPPPTKPGTRTIADTVCHPYNWSKCLASNCCREHKCTGCGASDHRALTCPVIDHYWNWKERDSIYVHYEGTKLQQCLGCGENHQAKLCPFLPNELKQLMVQRHEEDKLACDQGDTMLRHMRQRGGDRNAALSDEEPPENKRVEKSGLYRDARRRWMAERQKNRGKAG